VELREVPVPDVGPGDVLLEVDAVGVCGSDLHMWTGQQSWKVNYPACSDTNLPAASPRAATA
jgi:alcohol dehydrogenase/L-iditol 2-dehydrogenase